MAESLETVRRETAASLRRSQERRRVRGKLDAFLLLLFALVCLAMGAVFVGLALWVI